MPAASAAELNNTLKDNESAYLVLHADDPVNWQQWGQPVLDQARRLNRPVYISTGYFSCHWCHVMQRESFSNETIAGLLNDFFIPVKVDREMHPALDAYLLDFVRQTEGIAGWPLNVILTPEGYPLYGSVYQPPGKFKQLLVNVAETWKTQADKASRLAREAAEYQLIAQKPYVAGPVAANEFNQRLMREALAAADEFQGGFGEQSRFPMAPQLGVMLALYRSSPDPSLKQWLILSLDQMKNRGLRDHVHGGFFRYTVDPGWTEPHYEKMLYTQALLVQLFILAADVLQRPDYLDVAGDTLAFISREMKADAGGYVASFSAVDDQGNEGLAYLWSQPQLSAVLNPEEQDLANRTWFNAVASQTGALQLPFARHPADTPVDAELLVSIKLKLRNSGRLESIPVDHKVITAWNALLLSAYAIAAEQLADSHYTGLAKKLRDQLLSQHWKDGQLFRTRFTGEQTGEAYFEDYVFLAKGLRDYAVLTASQEDWYLSNLFLAKAWLLFRHQQGWQSARSSLLPGMQSTGALADTALPAADAWLVSLSLTSDSPVLQEKARHAAPLMFETVMRSPLQMSSHFHWINLYRNGSG